MIKTKRTENYIIVQGDPHELDRVEALSGITLPRGDKLTMLPASHHVHRNPIRKPILRFIADQERANGKG